MAHGQFEKMCKASYPNVKSILEIPKVHAWQYRWYTLGKPTLNSLDELIDLWNQKKEEKRKKRELYKTGLNGHSLLDYVLFDPNDVFVDEVKEARKLYRSEGWLGRSQKSLAEADVMYRHHYYSLEEYWNIRDRIINIWKGKVCGDDSPIPSFSKDLEDEDEDAN